MEGHRALVAVRTLARRRGVRPGQVTAWDPQDASPLHGTRPREGAYARRAAAGAASGEGLRSGT
jgi:hypothetical protein